MKRFAIILTALISTTALAQIIPQKGSDNGLFMLGIHDATIMITDKQNPYSYVYCGGCENVNFTNDGRIELTNGFNFNDSKNITVKGIDTFAINQHLKSWSNGYSISIEGKSSDITFDKFSIDSCGGGIWCKNEKFCDLTLQDWVLSNMTFKNFTIKNIAEHGSYIGATGDREGPCGYVIPSKTSNIQFINGTIENTGKNGLMINDCNGKPAIIQNVVIKNSGLQGDNAQGQNLSLGRNTKAKVYNVKTDHATTWGIRSTGSDTVTIDNCVVTNTGYPQNISIDNLGTTPMYFEACGNVGNISVSANVIYDQCKILPIDTSHRKHQVNPKEKFDVKVYDFMGVHLEKLDKKNVEIEQFRTTLPKNKYFILIYRNPKHFFTEKLFNL